MSAMKYCPDCGGEVSWRAFNRDNSRRSGLQVYCRRHHTARKAASRLAHLDAERERVRRAVQTLRTEQRAMAKAVRLRLRRETVI